MVVLLYFEIERLAHRRGLVSAGCVRAPVARKALDEVLVHADNERERTETRRETRKKEGNLKKR